MKWLDTITSKNYFTHNGNIQIQNEGLAMSAPSSGLISELFLQQMEHLLADLTVRFNEHKHAFQAYSHTSKFAQNFTELNHTFGTIHNTMQILRHHRKGPHLKTLERFHIKGAYTPTESSRVQFSPVRL
jgi:hypothetical protein